MSFGRVLFIYTGGTLGMKHDSVKGYIPATDYLTEKMASISQFHDAEYSLKDDENYMSALLSPSLSDADLLNNSTGSSKSMKASGSIAIRQSSINEKKVVRRRALVTPLSKLNKRILYAILEYEPLLGKQNV